MKLNDEEFWRTLSPLFADDDGGLYDIRLIGLTSSSVCRLAAYLQKCALRINGQAWDRILNTEIDVTDLSQAALQVGEGRLEPFHILLTGIQVNGIVIPDLGLFVWTNELTLDYRMGKQWSSTVLFAFFELLYQLSTIEPAVRLDLGEHVLPQWKRKFSSAFAGYRHHRVSNPQAG